MIAFQDPIKLSAALEEYGLSAGRHISALAYKDELSAHEVVNLCSYVENVVSSMPHPFDLQDYFHLNKTQEVSGLTKFKNDVYAYFDKFTDSAETRISDQVSVGNEFGSLYNGIANLINACNLSGIDFELSYPIVSAFATINKIAVHPSISVAITPIDLESGKIEDGFAAISSIIISSEYSFHKNLGEELRKIDARFDVVEKSIANINAKLSDYYDIKDRLEYIESFFTDKTLIIK